MKKILIFVPIITFLMLFLSSYEAVGYINLAKEGVGYFPDCLFPTDGMYPATTRQYGNGSDGIVDSPNVNEVVAGIWGNGKGSTFFNIFNQTVEKPTASGFGDDTSNQTEPYAVQANGLVSKYDNIMYRSHDVSSHYVYTQGFDNKVYHPFFFGIANPTCSFPNTANDILYKIYLVADIAWYRAPGTLSIWVYDETTYPYFFWNSFSIEQSYGFNCSFKIDITNLVDWNLKRVVGYTANPSGSDGSIDTWSYRIYYNFTGTGDYMYIDYLGITYEYITGDYFTNNFAHLSQTSTMAMRYESENSPYYSARWNLQISGVDTKKGYLYAASKDFHGDYYPSQWWPRITYPNSSCVLTDIKIIMTAVGDIPPCWFSFSVANSSAWSFAYPWLSDLQNGTTWYNSSTYPYHESEVYHWDGSLAILMSKYPNQPTNYERWLHQSAEFGYTGNMLDGITTDGARIPEMYVWDITTKRSWNISDVISTSVFNSTPLTVMVTFDNRNDYSFGIEYLGIFYGYTYGGGGYFPHIDIPENNVADAVVAMSYLLLIFLPGILIAEVVPKFGFVIGVIFSATILGIAIGNGVFLGFMVFTYLSVGVIMYKGGM